MDHQPISARKPQVATCISESADRPEDSASADSHLQPDPNIDDLKVAAATAKGWLISDKGYHETVHPAWLHECRAISKACQMMEKQQRIAAINGAQAAQGKGPMPTFLVLSR